MSKYLFIGRRIDNNQWIEGGYTEVPAPPVCMGDLKQPTHAIVAPDERYHPDWNMPYQMALYPVKQESVSIYTGVDDTKNRHICAGHVLENQGAGHKKFWKRWYVVQTRNGFRLTQHFRSGEAPPTNNRAMYELKPDWIKTLDLAIVSHISEDPDVKYEEKPSIHLN